MDPTSFVFSIFLIFLGGALLATMALFTRQSLLVAYMLLGVMLGPWGLQLIVDPDEIQQIGDIGIIFLLFLMGLNLHPQNLVHMLRKVTWIALMSSLIFGLVGFVIGQLFQFSIMASTVIGVAMMFSSTIIGLKLLPTTILHHQHTGEIMISVLLMQDLMAIVTLMILQAFSGKDGLTWMDVATMFMGFPILLLIAFLAQRYVLIKLLARFDQVHEYIFLLAIAWCLSLAEIAKLMGLSAEIGAFIAGVALAASPISLYIAENLKPLRDFFLVMFFFSIGAEFNLDYLSQIWLPALLLAIIMLLLKPGVFYILFHQAKESKHVAWEVGFRLGQASEFSLLLVYLSYTLGLIEASVSYLVQTTTIITFVISSYFVLLKYPTPQGFSERMRRD